MNPLILQDTLEMAQELGIVTDVTAFDTDMYIKGKCDAFHGHKKFQIHLHLEEREGEDNA